MANYSVILKNYVKIINEIVAAGTITPGMFLVLGSGGTVTAHATAGGNAVPKMFALEDALQGNAIDDNYVSGNKVQVLFPRPGDEVLAVLADGENVSIGDLLESNGDGYLKKYAIDKESFESGDTFSLSVYPGQIVGQALEALDLSDSSGAESSGALGYNKRIKIRIT